MSDRLTEIRERWARAASGPWEWYPDLGAPYMLALDGDWFGVECARRAEAEAVANAPADIAWLIAEVERLTSLFQTSASNSTKGE